MHRGSSPQEWALRKCATSVDEFGVKRQLATLAALSLPILGLATPASAQTPTTLTSEGSGDAIVVPLSDTVAGAEAGTSRWIAINWTSLGGESRDFKVTAQGSEGVHVSYPAYPVDGYSSGYQDDTLSSNEIDYTALHLTIDDDAPEPQFIRVTVSWVSDTGPKTDVIDMPIANDGGGTTSTTQPTTSVV